MKLTPEEMAHRLAHLKDSALLVQHGIRYLDLQGNGAHALTEIINDMQDLIRETNEELDTRRGFVG